MRWTSTSLLIFAATAACADAASTSTVPETPPVEENGAPAATAPAVELPPVRPPPDFAESRRFSPDRYDQILRRLVPLDDALQKASGAFIETTLMAIEKDFFEDDELHRPGAVVLLGEADGYVIGLTQRYFTDITYPTVKLIADGFGGAEIGSQYLDVFDDREACKRRPSPSTPPCRKHRFQIVRRQPESNNPNHVQAQTFDDHDITLLYFPRDAPIISDRETMGLARPAQAVQRHIRDAEQLYGFKFTLVSQMAFQEMKSKIKVEGVGDRLLVSAATMVLGPLVHQLTSQIAFPPELMATMETKAKDMMSEKVAAYGSDLLDTLEIGAAEAPSHRVDHTTALIPTDVTIKAKLKDGPLTAQGALSLGHATGDTSAEPLGVVAPAPGEQASALASFLAKTTTDADITLVFFEQRTRRAMILVPNEQVNLNYELLRHGLLRLAVEDTEVLQAFPELVEAAQAALDAGTGFARDWKSDGEYLAQVRHAATL